MKRWAHGCAALLLLLLSAAVAISEPVLAGEPAAAAAIAKVLDDSFGWFANKDFDLLFKTLAADADFFIFHPDSKSTIRGAEAFRKLSENFRDPDLKYAGHKIRDLRITVSRAGDVAWFSALVDDCSEYRGQKSCWDDCRWTGVLEQRDGRWVIVQNHFSFAEDKVAEKTRQTEQDRARRVFGTYQEMRGVAVELFGQKRFAEAAAILAGAVARYPDHVLANTSNLALMYASLGDREEAVRALEDGHRRGIFYGKWAFHGASWDTLRNLASFQRVLARNEELIAAAQESTTMKLEVVTPANYDPGQAYPLFIALHGGEENLAQFKPRWTSPRLREEFIVAYVQSSQVASMDGFHWQDDAITLKDLGEAYRSVVAKHAVDPRRVLVGGFSSGGYGALVTLLAGQLPISGFVLLCPDIPGGTSRDVVKGLADRAVRGTLLTNELDEPLEQQRQFVDRLIREGLDVRFIVTPNLGHWYPDDLEHLLDEAVAHIDSGT